MARCAVVIADGQRLFADALVRSLQGNPILNVSPQCLTTGLDAVKEAAEFKPDVVLLDYWITGMNGPATTRELLKNSPTTIVIFLARFYVGPLQRNEARQSGAVGFVRTNCALDRLISLVQAVASGLPSPEDLIRVDRATPFRALQEEVGTDNSIDFGGMPQEDVSVLMSLSRRELEVLQLLRQGLTPDEIGIALSITTGTAKNHLHRILRKTRTQSQLEVVRLAEDSGVVSLRSHHEPSPRVLRQANSKRRI